MTSPTPQFTDLISSVEHELARIYAFAPQSEIMAHLMTRDEVESSLGTYATSKPEFAAPGAVWMLPATSSDELFIGVHFDEAVIQTLDQLDPRTQLNEENLEAFCVIIEEISHFHMILNRAQSELEVTKLELECQGEMDKLLVSGLLLERQSGDAHVLPLARKLYDLASIVAEDSELYWQATKFAARFWFEQARDTTLRLESNSLKEQLRQIYRSRLDDRLQIISRAA